MSDQKYPAPPIFDAIVELRLLRPLNAVDLQRVCAAFTKGYENHEVTNEVQVEVRIEQNSAQTKLSDPAPVHQFSNADQTNLARVDAKKLHWSRLAPYEGWLAFRSRIFTELARLPKKIGLPSLERIGVRYRNRIDVPSDDAKTFRYEDYLSVNLNLPKILDMNRGYQWTVTKLFPEEDLAATVSSTIQPSPIPNSLGVLLDIDVFCDSNQPTNIETLSRKLEQMREKKNEIFEACITDKARKAFQ